MWGAKAIHVELNGRPVDDDPVSWTASSVGHFTAMQVRNGATRGLDLHLARLIGANREMFDAGLDADRVRSLIRHALGRVRDASVRVYMVAANASSEPNVVVTVKQPGEIVSPQRLRSVGYQRPRAHLKHLATEQGAQTRAAQEAGFDDALLTSGDRVVSESATANIWFFEGDAVIWPDAPLLRGITMQLLDVTLPAAGVPVRRATVRVTDVPSLDGAFLSNARGIAMVTAIDDIELPDAVDRIRLLRDTYASVPWDPI